MQILPAVDVLEGRVVRLELGDYERGTVYADDPAAAALGWMGQGADLVHVVDLSGARHGTLDETLVRTLAEQGVRFQIGGGIRSLSTARTAVRLGAERVVVGTAVVASPGVLTDMVEALGPERVVAAVDVKEGHAMADGWLTTASPLAAAIQAAVDAGCRRLLTTSIARDGMMTGPDLDLLSEVRSLAGTADVIASGGIRSEDDIHAVRSIGCTGVVVGKALYEGTLDLAQTIAAVDSH